MVDDQQVNQQLAMLRLQGWGHRVDVVNNGKEAIESVRQIPYDLIFMDCQMPEMDGYEATSEIRRLEASHRKHLSMSEIHESSGRIPIIAMTANAMAGDREKCLNVGMDDYLAKPIKPTQLADVLVKWLPKNDEVEVVQSGPEPSSLDSADSDATSPIDHNVVKELRTHGGPAFVVRMIDQFVSDATACVTRLQAAIDQEDQDIIVDMAHALKGMSRNMGAEPLGELCRFLEQEGTKRVGITAFREIRGSSTGVSACLSGVHPRKKSNRNFV